MPEKIKTTLGEIQGFMGLKDIHTFLGIPYGASTAGVRRFRPPVPTEPWDGVRDATSYGPSCPQGKPTLSSEDPASIKGLSAPVGEDCLVLNVWTPGIRDGGGKGRSWYGCMGAVFRLAVVPIP